MKRELLILVLFFFISCSSDDNEPEVPVVTITSELLSFTYTIQTSTTEDRLAYQIKFVNSSPYDVEGYSRVTTNSDGIISTTIDDNQSSCYLIQANSSCILNFDKTDNNPLIWADVIEFVSAEFRVIKVIE